VPANAQQLAPENGTRNGMLAPVTTRRGWRGDAVYFDHTGPCTDTARHRNCPGRWRGAISLGFGADGKRTRRKVSGTSRTAVIDRLARLHAELDAGSKATPSNYTVRRAAEDRLEHGLNGRSPKTIRKNKDVLEPILTAVGAARLRDLSASDVDSALAHMSQTYSTAAVRMGHLALKRAIRHAQARRYVTVNVADLADTPAGQPGRPSKALTLSQSAALLKVSSGTRIGAYIALSLGTGIRTEEARALHWEAVDFGDSHGTPPRPPSVAVRRSVRSSGDTKTAKSRRTLAMPEMAVASLLRLQAAEGRTTGPVFATREGGELDAANVRREFRVAARAAAHIRLPHVRQRRTRRGNRPPRRSCHLPDNRTGIPAPAQTGHGKRGRSHEPAVRGRRLTSPLL